MIIRKPGAVAAALLASLAAGCTQTAAFAPQSRSPIYASDLEGKAAVCTAPSVTPEAGKTVAAAMTTGGHGWCGLSVADGGKPFSAGLVERRPDKGKVFIHTVGDDTRIDYTPDSAAVADNFSVELIPGNAILGVSVQPAGAAPAQPANTPAANTPAANKGVAK